MNLMANDMIGWAVGGWIRQTCHESRVTVESKASHLAAPRRLLPTQAKGPSYAVTVLRTGTSTRTRQYHSTKYEYQSSSNWKTQIWYIRIYKYFCISSCISK